MAWLLPRLAIGLVAFLIGGLAGRIVGGSPGTLVGAALAGMAGLAAVMAFDAVRGGKLLRWLRGSGAEIAPRDAGFWGEVAYRVERSMRELEREARAERERLAQFVSAMEASPNGVLLLDAKDQIEWCNVRAADHFGLDPKRDRRQQVTNLIRSPAFVAYLQTGHFDEPVAFPGPRGGGTIEVVVRRYGGDAKLVLSLDKTERELADAMRRDFVANVSHEIRTPLTVLSGFLETMRNLPLTEVERERVMVLMTQQAERMGKLVDDLLTLARLEGSPRPAPDDWVAVTPILARMETEARALSAGRHTIDVRAHVDSEIAGIEIELQSAMTNLVTNAVRYTADGGTVCVAWTLRPNGAGEFTVVDSGRGIAREHLSRLTERFYRVDSSRSRESGGTGLGLAIVKHVVQRHGGELDIASEPGHGSTFRLLFPAARVRLATSSDRTADGPALTELATP